MVFKHFHGTQERATPESAGSSLFFSSQAFLTSLERKKKGCIFNDPSAGSPTERYERIRNRRS